MKYTFTLENLNCAHCAGKIEQKIAVTEGYENVSFNFATKTLRFETSKKRPLAEIQQICDDTEEGVTVTDNDTQEKKGFRTEHWLLIIAIVCGAAALVIHWTLPFESVNIIVFAFSLLATVLAGWKVFVKAFKNLIKLRFEETVLMSVAIIAAFCLGEYMEGAMVTILFTIGEWIEDAAVDASRRDIEKLSQICPDTAVVLHNGHEEEVAADSVAVGEIIIVKPHARIPIDGVVVEGSSAVDNAALTGESVPVLVAENDEVVSGAINGDSMLKVRTTKAFGESTATRILQMIEDAAAQKGKSEKLITRFASVYTPIVVGLAVLMAVLPPLMGWGTLGQWSYNALVILVASCPCAIVISVPLAYFSGIGAASRQGMLIKGGRYLEALAASRNFVFDKTGTLTTGNLCVKKIVSVSDYTESDILRFAAATEAYSSHPIARAICCGTNVSDIVLTDYREIAGQGTSGVWNGKKLFCGKLHEDIPEQLREYNVFLTLDGALIGAVQVTDTVRREGKEVIEQLKELGAHQTVMLTGDSQCAAVTVAEEVGIDSYRSSLLPADKLYAVKSLGSGVCFVGDGINDAPVLTASDCGVAMGLGSEAAIEAADAVLSGGTLHALPKAVATARRTIRTIRTNIIFALAVKAAVILLACFGFAAIWMSVVADTGVCVLCVLYTARLLKIK